MTTALRKLISGLVLLVSGFGWPLVTGSQGHVVAADCERTLRVALLPSDEAFVSVKVKMPLDPQKPKPVKRIVGDPIWNGAVLEGTTTGPFYFGPCQVIRSGAVAKVKIVSAEKPSKEGGRGGVIELQLTELEFSDGGPRRIDNAASSFVRGESQPGKILWIIPRKGKKAYLDAADTLNLRLVPEPPRTEGKTQPIPTVFYMCPEHCDAQAKSP